MNTIIIIAGLVGSGKNALGDRLATQLRARHPAAPSDAAHSSVQCIGFADPIKEIAAAMLGIPLAISHGTQKQKLEYMVYGKSARQWLQWLGTEMGRDQVHKDIWIHRAVGRALNAVARFTIITDGRFPNELSVTREQVGDCGRVFTVRIDRPGVGVAFSHASETSLATIPDEAFDAIVLNDGTLENLHVKAAQLAARIIHATRDGGPL